MSIKISVIGLGYAGLSLFVELSKKFDTVGFDINKARIRALQSANDLNNEVSSEALREIKDRFSFDDSALENSDVFIVVIPTPVDEDKQPDLSSLISATELVASKLQTGNLVIFESTVYPGCTEEVCVPLLEKISGLVYDSDFGCGYSPERSNPGDKEHTICNISKVISASSDAYLDLAYKIYSSIIDSEVYKAQNIKTAEAAKVIENIQRDVNIALVNEWSIIFHKLNIDTHEVLKAAGTKWNFLDFKPGLVGGHCISVDPYYMQYKAKEIGEQSALLSSARLINEHMPKFIAQEVQELIKSSHLNLQDVHCTILGFTFKENCPDVRNTKVYDLYTNLESEISSVSVFDPIADKEAVKDIYNFSLVDEIDYSRTNLVILAVGHEIFRNQANLIEFLGSKETLLADLKNFYPSELSDWRL